MERTSTEIGKAAEITAIETSADRGSVDSELAYLAPAAAAALGLLADAIKRGTAGRESVVQALKEAAVHERFADVLAAASEDVMDKTEDPYDGGRAWTPTTSRARPPRSATSSAGCRPPRRPLSDPPEERRPR